MNNTRHVVLAALASTLTIPAFAEQSPIIVTATRTAQTVDETLASVTVITKEQIQQQQANDLYDLLSSISSIDMINSGGFGKSNSLYMRGTDTGHVLVMVDGVPFSSATLGAVAYQDIPVDLIEKIEIIRGPRASLYGSEAIGGVIQIFTRRPTDKTGINFTSTLGSNNTKKNTAGLSGGINKTSYSLQASSFSTDGINAAKNNDPDKDGYKQKSANIFIRHQFNNTDNIEATFFNSNNESEYDGYTTTSDYNIDGIKQLAGLKAIFSANPNWLVTLKANKSKDYSDYFQDSIKTDIFNTDREIYTWQNDISIGDSNLFTVGLENKNTAVSGTSTFSKSSLDNNAVFIQNDWSTSNNSLLVSVRRDDNESFGAHTTGNISWSHNLYNDAHLILSAGTAFKAPSFNDLYYPLNWGYVGNPDVLPETSENYEISYKKKNFQLNLYQTDITNLISWEFDSATGNTSPVNIGSSTITGIEFIGTFKLAGWDTKINTAFTDPVDNSTGKVLENRSKESLRVDMDKSFTDLSLGATLKFQGDRYAATNTLASYALLDLRASYQLNNAWSVNGKVTNTFDEEYTLTDGYNTEGRSVYVSIHYQGL